MTNELDKRLLPMCSTWTISFVGAEKKTAFNHVLADIGAIRTTRWIVKAIRKAGGKVLNVTEYKSAHCYLDVSSSFGVRKSRASRET